MVRLMVSVFARRENVMLAPWVTLVARRTPATVGGEETVMGTPADYTILVLLVAVGVGVWTVFDRLASLQRDVDALKRKLGVSDPPDA
jgi:hypothetical protein